MQDPKDKSASNNENTKETPIEAAKRKFSENLEKFYNILNTESEAAIKEGMVKNNSIHEDRLSKAEIKAKNRISHLYKEDLDQLFIPYGLSTIILGPPSFGGEKAISSSEKKEKIDKEKKIRKAVLALPIQTHPKLLLNPSLPSSMKEANTNDVIKSLTEANTAMEKIISNFSDKKNAINDDVVTIFNKIQEYKKHLKKETLSWKENPNKKRPERINQAFEKLKKVNDLEESLTTYSFKEFGEKFQDYKKDLSLHRNDQSFLRDIELGFSKLFQKIFPSASIKKSKGEELVDDISNIISKNPYLTAEKKNFETETNLTENENSIPPKDTTKNLKEGLNNFIKKHQETTTDQSNKKKDTSVTLEIEGEKSKNWRNI